MTDRLLFGPFHPDPPEQPRRLVVFLHGYGANGDDLIGLAEPLAPHLPGTMFHSLHAPEECEGAPFGRQWFSLQGYDPGMLRRDPHAMGPIHEAMARGARDAAPVLQATLDALLAHYGLDDGALALVGFSQGTMMALHVALRRPKPVAAVVGFSGVLVGAETLARECTAKPPVLLIHGDADEVVPVQALDRAAAALLGVGIQAATVRRPGLGHGIDGEGLGHAGGFLRRHLPG